MSLNIVVRFFLNKNSSYRSLLRQFVFLCVLHACIFTSWVIFTSNPAFVLQLGNPIKYKWIVDLSISIWLISRRNLTNLHVALFKFKSRQVKDNNRKLTSGKLVWAASVFLKKQFNNIQG